MKNIYQNCLVKEKDVYKSILKELNFPNLTLKNNSKEIKKEFQLISSILSSIGTILTSADHKTSGPQPKTDPENHYLKTGKAPLEPSSKKPSILYKKNSKNMSDNKMNSNYKVLW